jgi:hypothetical protein
MSITPAAEHLSHTTIIPPLAQCRASAVGAPAAAPVGEGSSPSSGVEPTENLRVGYLGWLRKPSEERDYALNERKLYELRPRERHGTRARIAGGV